MCKRTATVALLLGVTATALAACVPLSSVTLKITPPAQSPAVIQRNATLTVPAGTYGMAKASCATGETMVSGGWSTTAVLPAPFTLGVLASYPSDSTGAPPLTQGQAETSWTVRAVNQTSAALTYAVSVDCLVGVGTLITNSMWFQTAKPADPTQPDLSLSATVECPDTVSAVTGGGFDYQPPPANLCDYGFPFGSSIGELDGSGNWAWIVYLNTAASATGFAVCVTAPKLAQAPFQIATDGPVNQTGPNEY
jgi:hypothetical protein